MLVELACGLRQHRHRLVEALPIRDEVRLYRVASGQSLQLAPREFQLGVPCTAVLFERWFASFLAAA